MSNLVSSTKLESATESISNLARLSEIFNLKTFEDKEKQFFSFTQQSIENSAQFLETIASHPRIIIDSIDIEFSENRYEIISVYRNL